MDNNFVAPSAPDSGNQISMPPAEPAPLVSEKPAAEAPLAPAAPLVLESTVQPQPTATTPEAPATPPPANVNQEIDLAPEAPSDVMVESTPEEIDATKKIIAVDPETIAQFDHYSDALSKKTMPDQ